MVLSVCNYIECRVKSELDIMELERVVGYSYPHIRKTFREVMQIPLARYILLRRLSYAAFDLIHTERSLLDISIDYGFEQYDAFTRAFKRVAGTTPSEFRTKRLQAGRRMVASGVYAPAILDIPSRLNKQMEVIMKQNTSDSCILLGVPKVEYKYEELTPFPACLKACLNYMGQDISYTYLMAASGAAFRLRWNKNFWDGGNVDICYIYDDETEAFRRSFEAAGRSFRLLKRADSEKRGFIDFIRAEIDNGRPVIALGIIGPQEACIVAGYQDNGETLLGWNFFQHRPEFNTGTEFHECGYFISKNWWENRDTIMLMSIGEEQQALPSDKQILQNAIQITDRAPVTCNSPDKDIACGQEAYKIWAEWIEDDKQFAESITLPLLFERFMCQTDAQTMVGEGRAYAAEYIKTVATRHPELSALCLEAAENFSKAHKSASEKMYGVLGGYCMDENAAKSYSKPDTRQKLAALIREAAQYEANAMEIVKQIVLLL